MGLRVTSTIGGVLVTRLAGLAALLVLSAGRATAQEEPHTSLFSAAVQSVKQTSVDPTTYIPAGLLYTSSRLDWASSQPLFQHGAVEDNPGFTVSGLPHDLPISYAAGNRKLLSEALGVVSVSVANNVAERLVVGVLATRHPHHRKLWTTLGWVERMTLASTLGYALSARHFEQWRQNQRLAGQLGY